LTGFSQTITRDDKAVKVSMPIGDPTRKDGSLAISDKDRFIADALAQLDSMGPINILVMSDEMAHKLNFPSQRN
jgi:hypothetical protein